MIKDFLINHLFNGSYGSKNFRPHLEIMRIVATFFVIFNHTGYNGFFLFYNYEPGSFSYWIYMSLSIFCKFSVPLFFAVSGALLLTREESIKNLFTHRIFRMFSVFLLTSFVYYIISISSKKETFDLLDFLTKFVVFEGCYWNFSLWFLYIFINYLVLLPFLRAMIKNMSENYYYYGVIVHFVFISLLPIINYLACGQTYFLDRTLFCLVFPIIGFYLEYNLTMEKLNNKKILYLWIINAITISISCILTNFGFQSQGVHIENFHNSFVIVNCIVIYITIKYICCKISFSKTISNILISIGRCTFGIYLAHMAIMIFIINKGYFDHFPNHINHMLAAFIFCSLVFVMGYFITLILKRIPIIGKLI